MRDAGSGEPLVSQVGSVLLIFLCFSYVVLLCVFKFWVWYCDVRYNFYIKTMFCSSLPRVVCRSAYVLFTLFIFVCVYQCPTHIVLCFCFVKRWIQFHAYMLNSIYFFLSGLTKTEDVFRWAVSSTYYFRTTKESPPCRGAKTKNTKFFTKAFQIR